MIKKIIKGEKWVFLLKCTIEDYEFYFGPIHNSDGVLLRSEFYGLPWYEYLSLYPLNHSDGKYECQITNYDVKVFYKKKENVDELDSNELRIESESSIHLDFPKLTFLLDKEQIEKGNRVNNLRLFAETFFPNKELFEEHIYNHVVSSEVWLSFVEEMEKLIIPEE